MDARRPTINQAMASPAGLRNSQGQGGDEAMRARTLWLAVIHRAIEDAANPTAVSGKDRELEKRRARAFLEGSDLHDVCDLAGLHPDDVRRRARELIKEHEH